MKLKRLRIELQNYGPHAGNYTGKIAIGDEGAEIELNVGPDITHAVLKVCIGQLTDAVDRSAQELRQRLIASVNHVPLMLQEETNNNTDAAQRVPTRP